MKQRVRDRDFAVTLIAERARKCRTARVELRRQAHVHITRIWQILLEFGEKMAKADVLNKADISTLWNEYDTYRSFEFHYKKGPKLLPRLKKLSIEVVESLAAAEKQKQNPLSTRIGSEDEIDSCEKLGEQLSHAESLGAVPEEVELTTLSENSGEAVKEACSGSSETVKPPNSPEIDACEELIEQVAPTKSLSTLPERVESPVPSETDDLHVDEEDLHTVDEDDLHAMDEDDRHIMNEDHVMDEANLHVVDELMSLIKEKAVLQSNCRSNLVPNIASKPEITNAEGLNCSRETMPEIKTSSALEKTKLLKCPESASELNTDVPDENELCIDLPSNAENSTDTIKSKKKSKLINEGSPNSLRKGTSNWKSNSASDKTKRLKYPESASKLNTDYLDDADLPSKHAKSTDAMKSGKSKKEPELNCEEGSNSSRKEMSDWKTGSVTDKTKMPKCLESASELNADVLEENELHADLPSNRAKSTETLISTRKASKKAGKPLNHNKTGRRSRFILDEHFAPISPIPPTPPDSRKENLNSSRNCDDLHDPEWLASSSENPGQSLSPFKESICKSSSSCTPDLKRSGLSSEGDKHTSPLLPNKTIDTETTINDAPSVKKDNKACVISSKRLKNGVLELNFNVSKPMQLSFNPVNYDVSCVFDEKELPPLTNGLFEILPSQNETGTVCNNQQVSLPNAKAVTGRSANFCDDSEDDKINAAYSTSSGYDSRERSVTPDLPVSDVHAVGQSEICDSTLKKSKGDIESLMYEKMFNHASTKHNPLLSTLLMEENSLTIGSMSSIKDYQQRFAATSEPLDSLSESDDTLSDVSADDVECVDSSDTDWQPERRTPEILPLNVDGSEESSSASEFEPPSKKIQPNPASKDDSVMGVKRAKLLESGSSKGTSSRSTRQDTSKKVNPPKQHSTSVDLCHSHNFSVKKVQPSICTDEREDEPVDLEQNNNNSGNSQMENSKKRKREDKNCAAVTTDCEVDRFSVFSQKKTKTSLCEGKHNLRENVFNQHVAEWDEEPCSKQSYNQLKSLSTFESNSGNEEEFQLSEDHIDHSVSSTNTSEPNKSVIKLKTEINSSTKVNVSHKKLKATAASNTALAKLRMPGKRSPMPAEGHSEMINGNSEEIAAVSERSSDDIGEKTGKHKVPVVCNSTVAPLRVRGRSLLSRSTLLKGNSETIDENSEEIIVPEQNQVEKEVNFSHDNRVKKIRIAHTKKETQQKDKVHSQMEENTSGINDVDAAENCFGTQNNIKLDADLTDCFVLIKPIDMLSKGKDSNSGQLRTSCTSESITPKAAIPNKGQVKLQQCSVLLDRMDVPLSHINRYKDNYKSVKKDVLHSVQKSSLCFKGEKICEQPLHLDNGNKRNNTGLKNVEDSEVCTEINSPLEITFSSREGNIINKKKSTGMSQLSLLKYFNSKPSADKTKRKAHNGNKNSSTLSASNDSELESSMNELSHSASFKGNKLVSNKVAETSKSESLHSPRPNSVKGSLVEKKRDGKDCASRISVKRKIVFDSSAVMSTSMNSTTTTETDLNETGHELDNTHLKNVYHVKEVLKDLEKMRHITFNKHVAVLVKALVHLRSTCEVLFHVFTYLSNSRISVMPYFSDTGDYSILLPPSESCIVEALLIMEKKYKDYLEDLVSTAIRTLHRLVISKQKITAYGLASFCRVLVAICKQKKFLKLPVTLCVDLLKMKHQNAPFFIASMAGVWKELFQNLDSCSPEQLILHSSIAFGAQQRTEKSPDHVWNGCIRVIEECFSAPEVPDIQKGISKLMIKIKKKCSTGPLEDCHALTSALVVFAAQQDWEWIKEQVLNNHVKPALVKYATGKLDEKAFDLYCQLYIDISLLNPDDMDAENTLNEFIDSELGGGAIQDIASFGLMRLLLLKKKLLPLSLTSWFRGKLEHPKVKQAESWLLNRAMAERRQVSRKDII